MARLLLWPRVEVTMDAEILVGATWLECRLAQGGDGEAPKVVLWMLAMGEDGPRRVPATLPDGVMLRVRARGECG